MSKAFLYAFFSFGVALTAFPQDGRAAYQIIGESTTQPESNILRTEYVVQIGANPLNRINITRVRRGIDDQEFRGPVLLMSPLNFDSRFNEVRQDPDHYESSLAGELAHEKFDVWMVDDRINRGTLADCQNQTVDCTIMTTWDLNARVEDAEFARGLIAPHHPGVAPAIGGVVGGAIAAMAAVNAHPTHYRALFALQGTLYSADPAVQAYNQPFCAGLTAAIGQGAFVDGGAELFLVLTQLAALAPNVPADPGFIAFLESQVPGLDIPIGVTNHQMVVFIFSTNIVNPNFPTPTWLTATGNYATDAFSELDEEQFFQLLPVLNKISGLAQFRDILCSLAGAETSFVNNLGTFTGDVLLLGSEFSFGPALVDTAALFTHASDVDTKNVPGLGEQDLFFGEHRSKNFDKPTVKFLRSVF